MLPSDWVPHLRPADREVLGWIRPDGDRWVPVSLLGHDLTGGVEWPDAEEALETAGLAWLSGVWLLERPDDEPVRVRIVEVTPERVVVQTDDFGAIDVPVERHVLPWPAPPSLRLLDGAAPGAAIAPAG
jgi:hypothetical protein